MNINQYPTQLIIIGGGASIKTGIEKGLWDKLKGHFVIGINMSYKFHTGPTIQCFLDWRFYNDNKEEMSKLPLIITKHHQKVSGNNLIYLKPLSRYNRELKEGCYKGSLTGIYSLSLAIYLLNIGEIFLLGYDFGGTPRKEGKILTHFFQGQYKHKGVGKISYYNTKGRAINDFAPFIKEKNIKIYNVSMISKLNQFEKINYDKFFGLLNKEQYNQDLLRIEIRNKMKGKSQK